MVSLYITRVIVCIVPWCPVVYETSTASIQSIGFTVTGIPSCFSELLISFACDLWIWMWGPRGGTQDFKWRGCWVSATQPSNNWVLVISYFWHPFNLICGTSAWKSGRLNMFDIKLWRLKWNLPIWVVCFFAIKSPFQIRMFQEVDRVM